MAKIVTKDDKSGPRRRLAEDEAPRENNAEGKMIVKELVKKQTDVNISLDQQLSLVQHFTASGELLPLTSYRPGQSTLDSFSSQSKEISLTEKLRGLGWSYEDIQMAIDFQKGENFFREKHKKMGPLRLDAALSNVKMRLSSLDSSSISMDPMAAKRSRHEEELMKSVTHSSENSKLVMFAQSSQALSTSVADYPAGHPMNQLKEIEQERFGHLKPKPKQLRKQRQRQMRDETKQDGSSALLHGFVLGDTSTERGSQWDKKVAPNYPAPAAASTNVKIVERTYTCSPQTWYTIANNKPVFLGRKLPPTSSDNQPKTGESSVAKGASFVAPNPCSLLVPMVEIISQRLSTEDILKMPRFVSYSPGTPSKVLYVKNLAGSTVESDLVNLFGHFEDSEGPSIVYRLMGGKMKGQAFITMPSLSQATNALSTLNGYKLKGKPLVIQYGKQSKK